MKEQDVRQRIEGFLKSMPRAAAIIMAGLVGLACSSSGLKTIPEAGAASGGQAGGTISSETTGGAGGTIGTGGTASTSTSGTTGQGGTCATIAAICNQGDQLLAGDSSNCPVERECYPLQAGCDTVLCMLPEGVHCSDPLSCNPGDTQISEWDSDCDAHTNSCYTKLLCTQPYIVCRYGPDAGMDASTSDTGGSPGSSGGAKGDSGTAGSLGIDGTGGKGGTAGSPPSQGGICASYPDCDPGDQQVAIGVGLNAILPSTDCPAERECYTLHGCGPVMCLLPQGLHCNDSLSCNSGDTQIPQWDQSCAGYPSPCYENMLCGQSVVCRKGTDGGVDAGAAAAPRCGDGIVQAGEECDCGHGIVPVPAGCIEPNNDNTYGGCTTGCTWGPRCGDGVVQMNNGEQCDLGSQNGVFQNGLGICTLYCEWIPWLP